MAPEDDPADDIYYEDYYCGMIENSSATIATTTLASPIEFTTEAILATVKKAGPIGQAIMDNRLFIEEELVELRKHHGFEAWLEALPRDKGGGRVMELYGVEVSRKG